MKQLTEKLNDGKFSQRHSRSLAQAHDRHTGCARTTEFNRDKRILDQAKIHFHMRDRYHQKYNPRATPEKRMQLTLKSGRL